MTSTMFVQMSLVLSLALLGPALSGPANFMDCPGNEDVVTPLRRCCHSDQLPKGCECFDISSKTDFVNSGLHRPWCPKKIQAVFKVFTRYNRNSGVVIRTGVRNIEASPFRPGSNTLFVTHGFADAGNAPWLLAMKEALLNEGDFNVILVDWHNGANANYIQATANTRTVGAMVARMIQDLQFYKGVWFDKFHLIGHNLGAHVMGIAGKEIQRLISRKIGRITGLDPAGPRFERYSPNVRIDKFDASFVDIIHTNAKPSDSSGIIGTKYSIGHADFYPNGGRNQPSCPAKKVKVLSWKDFYIKGFKGAATCSQGSAVDFFIFSIRKCRYDPPRGGVTCTMGYHVNKNCRGDYYPVTGVKEPYC